MINTSFEKNESEETLRNAMAFLNKIGSETAHKGELTEEEQNNLLENMNLKKSEKERLERFIGINPKARQMHLDLLRKKLQ